MDDSNFNWDLRIGKYYYNHHCIINKFLCPSLSIFFLRFQFFTTLLQHQTIIDLIRMSQGWLHNKELRNSTTEPHKIIIDYMDKLHKINLQTAQNQFRNTSQSNFTPSANTSQATLPNQGKEFITLTTTRYICNFNNNYQLFFIRCMHSPVKN